jgi:hypothetical protein
MSIIYPAELRPTKMELLEGWLPQQPWFTAGAAVNKLGSFRFDDPDGEVGLETILVGDGGAVFHVPLSYRGSPLEGAETFLIGTMQHSVLGTRWVYDAAGDPCYVAALTDAILTGRQQAEQLLETGGTPQVLPESMHIRSTGPLHAGVPAAASVTVWESPAGTAVRAGDADLLIIRRLLPAPHSPSARTLTGTWAGQPEPVSLAVLAAG